MNNVLAFPTIRIPSQTRKITIKPHAIKVEDLDITIDKADELSEVITDFLSELNFSSERIGALDCRRRDGFIPHGNNFGGHEAISFIDQMDAEQWVSEKHFPNASATIEKYNQYDVENFLESKGLDKDAEMNEELYNEFHEYQREDDQSTVMFSCDVMVTSETSLNIRITVCVKDSPYHRQYDDLIDIDVTFKTIKGLKTKLNKILKRKNVAAFSRAVREAY